MKNTKIILGFPGIGKSEATRLLSEQGVKILDSDSSKFSWIHYDSGYKERNTEFPQNYIKHIKENLNSVDYILVSTHKNVIDAIVAEDELREVAMILHPSPLNKDEYMQRYKDRGNDDNFIKMMDDKYYDFLRDIYAVTEIPKYCLDIHLYLYDFITQKLM